MLSETFSSTLLGFTAHWGKNCCSLTGKLIYETSCLCGCGTPFLCHFHWRSCQEAATLADICGSHTECCCKGRRLMGRLVYMSREQQFSNCSANVGQAVDCEVSPGMVPTPVHLGAASSRPSPCRSVEFYLWGKMTIRAVMESNEWDIIPRPRSWWCPRGKPYQGKKGRRVSQWWGLLLWLPLPQVVASCLLSVSQNLTEQCGWSPAWCTL